MSVGVMRKTGAEVTVTSEIGFRPKSAPKLLPLRAKALLGQANPYTARPSKPG
jgi:hypothetical protein